MVKNVVHIPVKKMISEHKKLIKVLKHGSPKLVEEEIREQSKELKKYEKLEEMHEKKHDEKHEKKHKKKSK